MLGRCALRLRQCVPFARKRGVFSRRSAAGSGSLVARHRQVHAPCEAETGNSHKRRSAKQADRHGVLGYKGARRKRLGGWSTLNPTREEKISGPSTSLRVNEWRARKADPSLPFGMTHTRKSKRTTEEDYRLAPKASRRPSQSLTTNSRVCHGMLKSPRVNSAPWAAYSA